MDGLVAVFLAGMVLGLAGALHCAAMCGSIAAGASFLFPAPRSQDRLMMLLKMQLGRATSYTITGAVAGLAGAGGVAVLEPATALKILQWASAVSLMWIGLSVAGVLPAFALAGGHAMRVVTFADRALSPLRKKPGLAQFSAGLTWGLTPCSIVYGALFTAALTGSALSGSVLMAGFGAGTVPAVLAAAFGWSTLIKLKLNAAVRTSVGLTLVALAVASIKLGWIGALPWCATQ
jgi:hypothetical protein